MFEMTPAEYPGWYSVPLTFAGNVEDSANFSNLSGRQRDTPFKCGSQISPDNGGNDDIYQKLFAGEQTTYAVREFGEGDTKTAKLYEGLDISTNRHAQHHPVRIQRDWHAGGRGVRGTFSAQ